MFCVLLLWGAVHMFLSVFICFGRAYASLPSFVDQYHSIRVLPFARVTHASFTRHTSRFGVVFVWLVCVASSLSMTRLLHLSNLRFCSATSCFPSVVLWLYANAMLVSSLFPCHYVITVHSLHVKLHMSRCLHVCLCFVIQLLTSVCMFAFCFFLRAVAPAVRGAGEVRRQVPAADAQGKTNIKTLNKVWNNIEILSLCIMLCNCLSKPRGGQNDAHIHTSLLICL